MVVGNIICPLDFELLNPTTSHLPTGSSNLLHSIVQCAHIQYTPTDKTQTQINIWNHSTGLNHLPAPATLPRLLLFHWSQILQNPSVCFCRCIKSCYSMLMEGTQPQRGSTQIAGLSIPANHSGHRDRWNLVPSLLVPLYHSVLPLSLKTTKSNRQSACPSEEPRGQPLSCYPFDLK